MNFIDSLEQQIRSFLEIMVFQKCRENIIKFNTIESTHLYAVQLANEKKKNLDYIITADEQTNGIGKYNRVWVSLHGNLFVSIVKTNLRKIIPSMNDTGHISLTSACAIREAIKSYVIDLKNLKLHWPNDVYYKNKKISGILISIVEDTLVISVGVNINQTPRNNDFLSTSVKDILKTSENINVNEFLNILIDNMNKWFDFLNKKGFQYIKSYWLLNINCIGCKITVKNGSNQVYGLFSGIDGQGRLILQDSNNEKIHISSGDALIN